MLNSFLDTTVQTWVIVQQFSFELYRFYDFRSAALF
jgi:hypothetical protein